MAYINPKILYRREYQRAYRARRRGGVAADGHGTLRGAGDIQGMPELFAALQEVQAGIAVRVRRKALQTTAEELTKVAKQAVGKFDFEKREGKENPAAVLRRAIYRRDPKTRQVFDKAKRRWRKTKPMSYKVSVRVGKKEQAGFVDEKGKTRKLNRDAYWWHWVEKGTKDRRTKRKGGRGRVEGQHVFRDAFDANANAAIRKGEAAGHAELKRLLARARAKSGRVKPGITKSNP